MTKFSKIFCTVFCIGTFGLAQSCLADQPEVANFSPGAEADQNFTVPDSVYSIDIEMRGGYGGDSTDCRHFGGRGAMVTSNNISVTPGQVLAVKVGEDGGSTNITAMLAGVGGWPNGGGGECDEDCCGAGGAGASMVLDDQGNVLVAAAGGGGAAGSSDGCNYSASFLDTSGGGFGASGNGGGGGGYPYGGTVPGVGPTSGGGEGESSGQTVVRGGGSSWGVPDNYGQYARAGQQGYITITWTSSADTTPPAAPSGLSVD
jgi:hypothetical protein